MILTLISFNVVSARFLFCEVIIFPFVVIRHLVGIDFETTKISSFSLNFHSLSTIFYDNADKDVVKHIWIHSAGVRINRSHPRKST